MRRLEAGYEEACGSMRRLEHGREASRSYTAAKLYCPSAQYKSPGQVAFPWPPGA